MRRAVYVVGVTLLVSCGERGALPTDENAADRPLKPVTRAEVIRDQVGTAWNDPTTSLAVLLGFGAEVTAAGLCEGNFTLASKFATIVFTPSGGFLAGAGGGRNVPVQLFDYDAAGLNSFCDLVGAPVVASGLASFKSPVLIPPSGGFVQTVTAHGIVDLTSGGQARLRVTGHITIRPDGTVQVERISITLTPLYNVRRLNTLSGRSVTSVRMGRQNQGT
jgi:hypothetical protein